MNDGGFQTFLRSSNLDKMIYNRCCGAEFSSGTPVFLPLEKHVNLSVL